MFGEENILRKLKVLYCITKLELGGAQKTTLDILRYLPRTRYSLSLATSPDGVLIDEARNIPDVKVYLIPTLKCQIGPLRDLRTIVSLYRLFKKERFDIVHTHSSKAGILGRWAAKFSRVPIIVHTIHGFAFYDSQNWFIKNFYILLEKMTARITDRLIAVSNQLIQKGLRTGIGSRGKYSLIHCGINKGDFLCSDLDKAKGKGEFNLDLDTKVVGMVACLKPQKSPFDYIEAAAQVVKVLPKTKFLLVGDGILRHKVERSIGRFGLREEVILTGWRRDISSILAIMDIFVLSSLWEGLPLVLLEAMASAKPIVATGVDGIKEVVRDGINGFLVPPGESERLAQRIITLLENGDLARRMGEKGRRFLDSSFGIGRMVDRIGNLYEKLASEKLIKGS